MWKWHCNDPIMQTMYLNVGKAVKLCMPSDKNWSGLLWAQFLRENTRNCILAVANRLEKIAIPKAHSSGMAFLLVARSAHSQCANGIILLSVICITEEATPAGMRVRLFVCAAHWIIPISAKARKCAALLQLADLHTPTFYVLYTHALYAKAHYCICQALVSREQKAALMRACLRSDNNNKGNNIICLAAILAWCH